MDSGTHVIELVLNAFVWTTVLVICSCTSPFIYFYLLVFTFKVDYCVGGGMGIIAIVAAWSDQYVGYLRASPGMLHHTWSNKEPCGVVCVFISWDSPCRFRYVTTEVF